MTDLSFIEIYTASAHGPRLNIRARFGEGEVKQKGGGGVWEEVKRPYLPPLTVWRGPSESFQYEIPILFDGFSNEHSVTKAKRELDLMAGVLNGDKEPPLLILNASGTLDYDYEDFPHLQWVLKEPPEWTERVLKEDNGDLIRTMAKVTLMVFNSSELTQRHEVNKSAERSITHAKAGDTFESIAHHRLGRAGWGTRLANLNGRQNAREHLHTGQEVLLPDDQETDTWERSRRR